MRSLVLVDYNHLEVQDTPVPALGSDEVMIRIATCGICGSDVHGYDGSSGRRIPPIVMGHEAAGVIESVGGEVKEFKPGERVTFDSTVFCGRCEFCLKGKINLCNQREVVGVSCEEYRRMGAFAELIVVPARIVYRLPDDLPFADALMLEAVSVALHAVGVSEPKPDESALVIGAGMIGVLTAQAAKALGFAKVLIADVDAARLTIASQLGIGETLHLSGEELTREVLQKTQGRGVDACFEAVGRDETVQAAICCVRRGGRVVLVGNIQPEVRLPLQKIVTREIRLQGSAASAGEYPKAMELMQSGRIQVRPLISAVASLEEGALWFDRLHSREPGLVKVVLSPNERSVSRD